MIRNNISVILLTVLLFTGCSSNDIKDFIDDSKDFINNDIGTIDDTGNEAPVEDANLSIVPASVQEMLDVHNLTREEVGVSSKLTWSDQLATDAQSYANKMAESGAWEHDPKNHTGYTNGPYGENLYISTAKPTLKKAAQAWADEKQYYTYGKIGDSSTCVAGEMCGHYTQMIWKDTSQVGCAMSQYKNGNYKDWFIVVCKYKTPGNYIGQTPY